MRRLRVGAVEVTIHPQVAADAEPLMKCLGTFEDFCMVTQSVRQGIDVKVRVEPRDRLSPAVEAERAPSCVRSRRAGAHIRRAASRSSITSKKLSSKQAP